MSVIVAVLLPPPAGLEVPPVLPVAGAEMALAMYPPPPPPQAASATELMTDIARMQFLEFGMLAKSCP
jgi:hypothetical protein